MDTLSIPFGHDAGELDVSANEWDDRPAVHFALINDARLIAAEHIPSLIVWLQGFVEENKPKLPTTPHATVRATLVGGSVRVLTLLEPAEDQSWASSDGPRSSDWYADVDIESFEVLFEGVED